MDAENIIDDGCSQRDSAEHKVGSPYIGVSGCHLYFCRGNSFIIQACYTGNPYTMTGAISYRYAIIKIA